MYHPTLGRWVTRDPHGYVDGITLYEYAISSPGSIVDPLGTHAVDQSWPDALECLQASDLGLPINKINSILNKGYVSGNEGTPIQSVGAAGLDSKTVVKDNFLDELKTDKGKIRVLDASRVFQDGPCETVEDLGHQRLVVVPVETDRRTPKFRMVNTYLGFIKYTCQCKVLGENPQTHEKIFSMDEVEWRFSSKLLRKVGKLFESRGRLDPGSMGEDDLDRVYGWQQRFWQDLTEGPEGWTGRALKPKSDPEDPLNPQNRP